MLTVVLAHAGQPPLPHDLWTAWNLSPALLAGLFVAVWAYRRGRRGGRGRDRDRWRSRSFAAALMVIGLALVSPLDALASALASAHMVQHVLLVLVAAPLLAFSAPSSTLLRGTPLDVRRASVRWRRRLGLSSRRLAAFRRPAVVWALYVGTLWFWHAAGPYGAALDNELLHVIEHVSFLVTGVLFWRVVIGTRAAGRVSAGFRLLVVFTAGLQGVFLSALLTFAQTSWYAGYATTTTPWGLSPLADQQLAGVLMWIPGNAIYLATALGLLVTWIRPTEAAEAQEIAPETISGRRGLA